MWARALGTMIKWGQNLVSGAMLGIYDVACSRVQKFLEVEMDESVVHVYRWELG